MNRPPLPPAPQGHTITGTIQIALPAPRTYTLGARRYRWSLLLVPLLLLMLGVAVHDVSVTERSLAAEGARAARVITYELDSGSDLRAPLDPGTDVVRIVAHAMRRGSVPLSPSPHVARLAIHAAGVDGARDEDVVLTAPGTTERVTPEDTDVAVGDPVSVNVDVHGIGAGELSIVLKGIEGADGLLVRIYRRDALHALDAVRRTEQVDEDRRAHFARRAGELDWVDLDDAEQLAILGARWKKVGAFHGSHELAARAIALAPPPEKSGASKMDAPIGVMTIQGDERAAFVAHGPTSVHGKVAGDPEAPVAATVRYEDGTVANVEAKGELLLKVPDGNTVGIELTSGGAKPIEVRAADPKRIDPSTHAAYWRATPTLPAIVTAGAQPLVLRVTARRPLARSTTAAVPIEINAVITSEQRKSERAATQTASIKVQRLRSAFDRYEKRDPMDAPTEKAVFYVMVPPNGSATLTPASAPLDLSLAELDPDAPPRPVASFAPTQDKPAVEKIGERMGDDVWNGFFARRPSNVYAFEPDAHGLLRIAHRYVPSPPATSRPPSFRILRPRVADTITLDKRIFDPISAPLTFELRQGDPVALPVHLYAAEPMDIVARIDGATPNRRAMGIAERVTTPRLITVKGESKAIVILGDDLAPGKHTLTFEAPPGKKAWVHVPWLVRKAAPKRDAETKDATPAQPHWVSGDFDN